MNLCNIDVVVIPKIDYDYSNSVYRIELAHRVEFLHKYNCLRWEEVPPMVSLASCCDQGGLPAPTTAQEGGEEDSKMDRKSKGLKVEQATHSGFSSLPQRQLHPHGISIKFMRKRKKNPSHSGQ